MRETPQPQCEVPGVALREPQWVDTTTVGVSRRFTVVSLCSGCGGLDLGFVAAGYRVLSAIECERHAVATYRANFPSTPVTDRPIEAVSDADLMAPQAGQMPDVLCCGLPCQAYSQCGRQDAMDPAAWLFPQLVRLAAVLKPKAILIENVPNLQHVHGGVFLRWILSLLAGTGYDAISMSVMDSAAYGVPQNRRRLIILANRLGRGNPYPTPILSEPFFRTVDSAISDLGGRPQDDVIDHVWPTVGPQLEMRISQMRAGEPLHPTFRTAYRRLWANRPSLTIMADLPHIHPHEHRYLSVREAARLQGFPDGFRFTGGVTAKQRQVGNAVPPPLAEHLALALRVLLDEVA